MVGLMKDELGETMKECVVLNPKMYSYFTDKGYIDKKTKGKKQCVPKFKPKMKLKDCKNCLEKNEKMFRQQQRFRSEEDYVCTEKVNKIALSSNRVKRFQVLYGIPFNPYDTTAGKM